LRESGLRKRRPPTRSSPHDDSLIKKVYRSRRLTGELSGYISLLARFSLYLKNDITITFRPAQDSSLGLAAKARFFSSTEATHHLGCMTLNVMQTMSCGFDACKDVMCS
jgi:hypothetical protein